ncbi:hypothetical protein UPYG_G00195450 [Umbra pygmaea]|uniref:Cytochrome P450 n=1 Tax=Umbra pygmaea TaxID=75934 RepID=A0ABD0WHY1_UMBPY
MDFHHILETNSVSILTGLVLIMVFWKIRERLIITSRWPPGPAPIPLLGNLLQMDIKAPYKFYIKLSKKYGSVFTVWQGTKPVVVISGYQAIKEAFLNRGEEFGGRSTYPMIMTVSKGYDQHTESFISNLDSWPDLVYSVIGLSLCASAFDIFSSVPNSSLFLMTPDPVFVPLPKGVTVSNGKRSKDLRRFTLTTLKMFGMGRRSIEQNVQEEAKILVKAFREYEDSVFNPKELICKSVINVICSLVIGHRFEYDEPKLQLIHKAITEYFYVLNNPIGAMYNIFPRILWYLPGKHQKMFASVNSFKDYIREQAELRLKSLDTSDPRDFIEAFLVQMLEEKDNPHTELNYDNLVMTVWNLFGGGTETTSSTLRYSFLMMIKFPSIQEKVQKEIDEVIGSKVPTIDDRVKMPYTDAVIHEIQRFMDRTPTALPHKVIRDTEFHSYHIPEGTTVLPFLSSILFDPKLFKNPYEFDPENFLDENGRFKKNDGFVAFGLGKRVCLGEALARMELFLFFTSLLQRFTFTCTLPPEEINIEPAGSSFGRMPRSFDCNIKVRNVE